MPTPEIIDQTAFDKLLDSVGGDVDFVNELLEAYVDSNPGLFADMQQAIAGGKAATLQRAAHSLKSASASFGALAFAAQCKELEDLGKTGALAGAEEKVRALEGAYADVVAALQARVSSARSAPA
jgi:HPt (histidine-containing phosphotransfer) domain-containing protein